MTGLSYKEQQLKLAEYAKEVENQKRVSFKEQIEELKEKLGKTEQMVLLEYANEIQLEKIEKEKIEQEIKAAGRIKRTKDLKFKRMLKSLKQSNYIGHQMERE